MEPPPGPRRARLCAVRLLAVLMLLPLSACGLLQTGVPAAPASSVATKAPTPSTEPTPSMESPSESESVAASKVYPSGWPTYSEPAEAACVVPTDGPESVAGADGPTLTAKQVAAAWKSSETGRSNRVSSGTVTGPSRRQVTPASVLDEPGAAWTTVSFIEWSGLRTFVYADPGRAAAKLAAIRLMLSRPCSYDFTAMNGPYLVVQLGEDQPDLLVVRGVMEKKVPAADYFIRYGNTVTDFSSTMVVPEAKDVVPLVIDVLSKA